MQMELKQLIVPPGNQVLLKDVSWQMYEKILDELGEERGTRIAYSQGILEIMTPLFEHEDDKEIIGDLVKVLLEEINLEFRSAAATTFKNEKMGQGIEADQCFYIQNEAAIRGKKRLDLAFDPPPDLAIEIDITSRTHLHSYEGLGVPELWRFNGEKLQIYVLEEGKYIESNWSYIFPNLPLIDVIGRYLEQSKIEGRNATMKAFRNWVREQTDTP